MSLNVTQQERKEIERILHGIIPSRLVFAFGSRVKGTSRPISDLDLWIHGDDPLTSHERLQLVQAFSNSNLPYFVDIVDDATMSEEFRTIAMDVTEQLQ